MNAAHLYAVVAISGAAVLAIEILGTRILGPFYGVSLYLWSALISVTLAALSVGYAIGGRWADRGPRPARLALLLAGAGLWIVAVPWLRTPVLALAEGWGLRAAVLAAATVLFFPPLMLLGMVSPYAIRLRAARLEEVGRTAGTLFAISTVASVVAAVATGFWLIPSFGVARLTLAIGLVLLAGAGVALLGRGGRRIGAAALLGLALPAALGAGLWPAATDAPEIEGLAHVEQSRYAEIRVLDRDGLRYLLIDGGVHTVAEPESWNTHHPYVVVAELAGELFERPGELLVIGLGGGSVVKSYFWSGWRVDAVEIDPAVVRVARTFFGLRDTETGLHVMDGRRYLEETGKRYDLVLFDAFGSSAIPFHLVTREAFALASNRLEPGGVLAVNVEAVGWRHPIVRSLAATLSVVFDEVVALPIAEPPSRLGNLILLASNRSMAISDDALGDPVEALVDRWEHWRVVQRNHAWENRFVPEIRGAPVLTDDRNPVDLWAEEINRVARRALHENFSERGSSW